MDNPKNDNEGIDSDKPSGNEESNKPARNGKPKREFPDVPIDSTLKISPSDFEKKKKDDD